MKTANDLTANDLTHIIQYHNNKSFGNYSNIFLAGPVMSGTLIKNIGFDAMIYGIATINFLYAPLMYFLKNPPGKAEENVVSCPTSSQHLLSHAIALLPREPAFRVFRLYN